MFMSPEIANAKRMPSFAEGFSNSPNVPSAKVPPAKRLLDLAWLLLALPTLLPLFLVIGAFNKVVSPGPVFFRQERVGFMGRKFWIYKFRTMHVDAETSTHQNHL